MKKGAKSNFPSTKSHTLEELQMATIIIGIGIGIIIVALAIEPDKIRQYRRYVLPMSALAGALIAIALLAP
jgi:uncharacterized membrane protein YgaE (UPF0421/DUF939 family)